MYEEVRELCHQWSNDPEGTDFTSPRPPPHLLLMSGAIRNLSGSLEQTEPALQHHVSDYLPALTMEELSSLHSPESADPLLYPEEGGEEQQALEGLEAPEVWTDCLQLTSDLPDWMETDTLTALQFPSLYNLG